MKQKKLNVIVQRTGKKIAKHEKMNQYETENQETRGANYETRETEKIHEERKFHETGKNAEHETRSRRYKLRYMKPK